jgi:hypothetical protein
MSTLSTFIGNLTHEDSRDGYVNCIILSDDITAEMREEALEDKGDDDTVLTLSREQMDLLAKSIDDDRDFHHIGDGELLDLVEPYILGWGE